jgi:ComF family protein
MFAQRFVRPVAGALARLRDFVVPATCMQCSALVGSDGGLCASCWSKARFLARPYCEVLGTPFAYDPGDGSLSAEAIAEPPAFERHRSVMAYGAAARRLVGGLKFSDRTDLAPWMAQLMAGFGRELIADCAIVVPVPLHRRRLWSRRFNQSAEIARHLCRLTGLQYAPLALARVRATRRQVGLGVSERARNVQGAFRVAPEQRPVVAGRRVLLVDDVYTTGATTQACARALKRAGAPAVDVLTFATAGLDDI